MREIVMNKHLLDELQNRFFEAFFEFLNAKFKNNEIDFKQLVDVYKSIRIDDWDYELHNLSKNTSLLKHIVENELFREIDKFRNFSKLDRLLGNKELFEELMQNNRLNEDDFKYLLSAIDKQHELRNLSSNTILLKYIIDKDTLSFKELVGNFKSVYELDSLLGNEELFKELIENNRLNKEDMKYLLNTIDKSYEVRKLNNNTILLKCIVDKDIVSLKELVDRFKSVYELNLLLKNTELFKELIQNNSLNIDDLRYLLNKIDKENELNNLSRNTPLIKSILNEFVLNKEIVDRFNIIIETSDWCKEEGIHTIFELIEYCNKNNKRILKLNELNKKVYAFDLNEDQKLELIEVLKNNEIAFNRLKYIVDNHLESNYDFESLRMYLKKKEKKSVLNI